MRIVRTIGTLTVAFGLAFGSPVRAAEHNLLAGKLTPDDRKAIEEIVREYILNNPEIIFEAADKVRAKEEQAAEEKRREAAGAVRKVDSQDHVRGNPGATVVLVEYSDFECPFCKGFHPTMKRIMDEYGKDGKVAWVYRHFPLDSIHSKARKEAQASECANEIGGNDSFWAYADRLFEIAPSNDRLDLALLPKIAEETGLDRAKFEACLAGDARGGKYADHIEADAENAVAAGGTGTPFSIVIAANGKTYPINGALPYEAVKSVIDLALAEK